MIDVHTFDGKLKGIFIPKREYSIEEKEESFKSLLPKLSSIAVSTVETIIEDMKTVRGNNYQLENDIDSSDILMEIINYDNLITILDEQLVDMKLLGICSSGRTTRLLQIWKTVNF